MGGGDLRADSGFPYRVAVDRWRAERRGRELSDDRRGHDACDAGARLSAGGCGRENRRCARPRIESDRRGPAALQELRGEAGDGIRGLAWRGAVAAGGWLFRVSVADL